MPAGVSARLSVMLTASGGQTLPAHAPTQRIQPLVNIFLADSFYQLLWYLMMSAQRSEWPHPIFLPRPLFL